MISPISIPNMNINALVNPLDFINQEQIQEQDAHSFERFFNAYMGLVNQTAEMGNIAERTSIDFALGHTDDMLAVILAQEQAYVALHFTVQVTSRIIQAYQEIMRMQV